MVEDDDLAARRDAAAHHYLVGQDVVARQDVGRLARRRDQEALEIVRPHVMDDADRVGDAHEHEQGINGPTVVVLQFVRDRRMSREAVGVDDGKNVHAENGDRRGHERDQDGGGRRHEGRGHGEGREQERGQEQHQAGRHAAAVDVAESRGE